MKIAKVFSFLTYPGKNKDDISPASGTEIPIDDGKLCRMLDDIYGRSDDECTIPIAFEPEGEVQSNAARTDLIRISKSRSLKSAAILADRLQSATGGSSGMALMFVCLGESDRDKIVISRFPADEGIVAEKLPDKLSVAFVEQVFLKSAHSYKAVMYKGKDGGDDYWSGFAVDKQINHGSKAVADYWIIDFLKSDFRTTAAAGTKRLALALKTASTTTADPDIRHEISMAVQLAQNIRGNRAMTISDFCHDLHLSDASKNAVSASVDPARLLDAKFRFDRNEFGRHIAYKSVELDNGAVLSAQVAKFAECFEEVKSKKDPSTVTYTTSGKVVNEKFRRTK